jgi:hypothetical protein
MPSSTVYFFFLQFNLLLPLNNFNLHLLLCHMLAGFCCFKKKADADRYSVEQAAAAAKAKQLAEADAEQYSIAACSTE